MPLQETILKTPSSLSHQSRFIETERSFIKSTFKINRPPRPLRFWTVRYSGHLKHKKMKIALQDITTDELAEFYEMVSKWCEYHSNTFVMLKKQLEEKYPTFCNVNNF